MIRYDAGMTVQMLQQAIKKRPFEPFEIVMANGDRVPVRHPDFILYPRPSRTVIVHPDNGDDDDIRILDLTMISELRVATAPSDAPPEPPATASV